ncbi:MAG: hypothetical protein QM762_09825 [Chryseolinea sp.]
MAMLSGFQYDVFISYRHNDNRSGWVTEFVNALQEELSATFKEPVSVYFDKDPHDGLLETHSVDKSLSGKLHCLVFIPIVSQTYCDPKSFAWENEFLVFNQLARADRFGPDIKLKNGNVASRILPIKIHYIDADDSALFEKELGGVLRGIDFIFKSPGVNRPLKPADERGSNLNHSQYDDQINKVANALKDVISALKHHESKTVAGAETHANAGAEIHANAGANTHDNAASRATTSKPTRSEDEPNPKLKKQLSIASLIVLLGSLAYFVYSNVTNKPIGHTDEVEKSIAVLPFRNIGPNNDDEYFSDGVTEEVINYLAKVGELNVMSRTSTEQYKSQSKDARTIASELGVSYILEGSVRKAANKFRVSVKLIEAETGFHVWSNEYDKEVMDVFLVQSDISREVTEALKVVLTDSERKNLESTPVVELTAYDFYLQARRELLAYKISSPVDGPRGEQHLMSAIALFRRAIQSDSKFR